MIGRVGQQDNTEARPDGRMDEIHLFSYIGHSARHCSPDLCLFMPTLTPHQDPTATTPTPYPTQPVAGRPVDDLSLTFDWTPLPNTTRYRLQVATTDTFDTLAYDETVERPATLDLHEALPDDAGTVYWRVRAVEEDRWSNTAHFATPGATDLDDESVVVQAEPVPVTPARNAVIDPSPATFTWEGVPEASGYQVQVGTTPEMESPIVDLTVDQTAALVLYDPLPEVEALHWRVRTLFPEGPAGPWSNLVSFSTVGAEEDTASGPDEARDPSQDQAAAAGPARHARTGRLASILYILIVVVSFLVTIGIVAWLG